MSPEDKAWNSYESEFKDSDAYKLTVDGKIIPPDVLIMICHVAFLNGLIAGHKLQGE